MGAQGLGKARRPLPTDCRLVAYGFLETDDLFRLFVCSRESRKELDQDRVCRLLARQWFTDDMIQATRGERSWTEFWTSSFASHRSVMSIDLRVCQWQNLPLKANKWSFSINPPAVFKNRLYVHDGTTRELSIAHLESGQIQHQTEQDRSIACGHQLDRLLLLRRKPYGYIDREYAELANTPVIRSKETFQVDTRIVADPVRHLVAIEHATIDGMGTSGISVTYRILDPRTMTEISTVETRDTSEPTLFDGELYCLISYSFFVSNPKISPQLQVYSIKGARRGTLETKHNILQYAVCRKWIAILCYENLEVYRRTDLKRVSRCPCPIGYGQHKMLVLGPTIVYLRDNKTYGKPGHALILDCVGMFIPLDPNSVFWTANAATDGIDTLVVHGPDNQLRKVCIGQSAPASRPIQTNCAIPTSSALNRPLKRAKHS